MPSSSSHTAFVRVTMQVQEVRRGRMNHELTDDCREREREIERERERRKREKVKKIS